MKKTTLTKKSKYINIVCIVAIVFAMCCQFISGWQYSGEYTADANPNDKRVVNMEMSVADFAWNPTDPPSTSREATAFRNYIMDPTLKLTEKLLINGGSITEEQSDAIGLIAGYKETKTKLGVKKSLDIATATLEAEDASTYPIVFDPDYNREEVLAEAAEDATAEVETAEATTEAEATEAEATEAEATEEPAKEVSTSSTDKVETKNILLAITTSHIDPIAKGQTTLLAKSDDKEAALASYNEYVAELESIENSPTFINGLIKFPTVLLVCEFLALLLLVFRMIKGKGTMYATVAAFLAGLFSLIYFYTSPIFLLFQESSFVWVDRLLSVVTVVGFVLAVDSIDYSALRNGLLKFTKDRVFALTISGIVITLLGVIASEVLYIGATSGLTSLAFYIGIVLLVVGCFSLLKSIISAYKDNKLVAERAGK